MLRLSGIRIRENISDEEVVFFAAKKKRIQRSDILSWKIVKKSVDARNKNDVHFSYTIDYAVKNEDRYPHLPKVKPQILPEISRNRKSAYRPVIVGSGPAGLFCALTLVENGYKPVIIERGDQVEKRQQYVKQYRESGILNPRCNVQFGEGGAGTFSDGKLTTGINSPYINHVLETFHRFGAHKEVTYLSHPHVGTDVLTTVVRNIREYIESKGGTYYFNTTFTDYDILENNLLRIVCTDKEFISDVLVLAIGHSARDTFEMLNEKQLSMKRKNFSVGVRIEHRQETINKAQYGEKTQLELPAAEYRLVYHNGKRTCYSFCMCPGGEVIASSSEQDGIVTNGMSEYARNKDNANSALLVNVDVDDLPGNDIMEGFRFQRDLEKKAYLAGGSNGFAPVQRVDDYLAGKVSEKLGRVIPSYKPGYTFADMNMILPDYVNATLKEGIQDFGRKISGFDDGDSILTGVETRTSSPVTVDRDSDLVSSVRGIYPCGEGCGYAGGITSAAVDGIKVAIKIIENT